MYYNTETGKYNPCCDDPKVIMSKVTCTCCWHCDNCGRTGCANLVGDFNLPDGTTPYKPFKKDKEQP
jgi:hypothetical protein